MRDTVTSHGKITIRVSQIASAPVLDVCYTRECVTSIAAPSDLNARKDDVRAAHHVMKIFQAFCLLTTAHGSKVTLY